MRPLSLLLAAILLPSAAHTQVVMGGMSPIMPSAATPGATITGAITCSDTNGPARLARVLLKPATVDDSAVDARLQTMVQSQEKAIAQARSRNSNASTPRPLTPQQQASMRQGLVQQVNSQSEASNSTTADFTGHYTLTGVPPGTYYVHVQMPGYVDALDQVSFDQITSPDPETAKRIAQLAPRITIIGTEEQRADLRIDRGASISGRVLYDDGSPAPGWQIMALPRSPATGKVGFPTSSGPAYISGLMLTSTPARSDDLGNFRLTGLAAGDYAIRASLAVASPGTRGMPMGIGVNMTLYSGDTFHMAEAKTFSLSPGQTRSGTDITVPLNKVHTISGHVVAKSDGHSPNSGSLSLVTTDDNSFRPYTQLSPDGSFAFYNVPAGAYRIIISSASDTVTTTTAIGLGTRSSTQQSHRYGSAETTVTLGDVDLTGITLTVPDAAAPTGDSFSPALTPMLVAPPPPPLPRN